jgi:hypothetical protein
MAIRILWPGGDASIRPISGQIEMMLLGCKVVTLQLPNKSVHLGLHGVWKTGMKARLRFVDFLMDHARLLKR